MSRFTSCSCKFKNLANHSRPHPDAAAALPCSVSLASSRNLFTRNLSCWRVTSPLPSWAEDVKCQFDHIFLTVAAGEGRRAWGHSSPTKTLILYANWDRCNYSNGHGWSSRASTFLSTAVTGVKARFLHGCWRICRVYINFSFSFFSFVFFYGSFVGVALRSQGVFIAGSCLRVNLFMYVRKR